MSHAAGGELEALLRQALAPVDPPRHLADRVEATLDTITEMAADELDGLELAAMRDPRNWVRPAAAVVAGGAAGAALVVLQTRRRAGQRRRSPARFAGSADRALREAVGELRRRRR